MTDDVEPSAGPDPTAATYLLPLRREDPGGLGDLPSYLHEVLSWAAVVVVDGSPPPVFASHARLLPAGVEHVPPEFFCRNGKVSGVLTGLARARTELLVIADDDVRYSAASFKWLTDLLADAELVRPQNYFEPLPWHARWDTARTLINRALGADYPGTLGVRRSILASAGGYSGDVLFENLELIRTVRAAGGREVVAPSLFVRRQPCSARHFWKQRVRQAYDGFAQPARMAAELLLLPALLLAWKGGRGVSTPAAAVLAVGLAELGRRRNSGRSVFPASSALWAPLWVLERSLGAWAALYCRLTGGVPYAGEWITTAGHSTRVLRRRLRHKAAAGRIPDPFATGSLRQMPVPTP
ncbi:glycosyltransferase [Arthrobacter sp. Helios]|uniref:glycosyltransferase n=1 Tax=Arthrobacter sp. Helios TaxID=2828862 RepID=UPI002052FBC1|nr:glycosyltransferase [Arthrobacter sp. Helios]UPO76536.1 glycosyltransferase [Arthrobacter sp. Helios]